MEPESRHGSKLASHRDTPRSCRSSARSPVASAPRLRSTLGPTGVMVRAVDTSPVSRLVFAGQDAYVCRQDTCSAGRRLCRLRTRRSTHGSQHVTCQQSVLCRCALKAINYCDPDDGLEAPLPDLTT